MNAKPGPQMTGPLVRKVIDGTKTMTSRPLKDQKTNIVDVGSLALPYKCGGVYYLREKWSRTEKYPLDGRIEWLYEYEADGLVRHWQPAMFMPAEAARVFIMITSITVRKIQNLTEADFIAEGCPREYLLGSNWFYPLWDSIYAKKGLGIEANPWVASYVFERVEQVKGCFACGVGPLELCPSCNERGYGEEEVPS